MKRLAAILLVVVCGCATRSDSPPAMRYDKTAQSVRAYSPDGISAAVTTRTWNASWDALNASALTLRIKVYWSSNLTTWVKCGEFNQLATSGVLVTPVSVANYFRTGYSIVP